MNKTFRKRLGLGFAALLAVVVLSNQFDSPPTLDSSRFNLEQLNESLVRVAGTRGYGSGVVIKTTSSGSYILTNKHVCAIARKSDLQLMEHPLSQYNTMRIQSTYLGAEFVGQVVKVSINSDLCLLFSDMTGAPAVKIASESPELGDFVYNTSNPMEVLNHATTGFVGSYKMIWGMRFQGFTAIIYGGSSGSGLFNDKGELIGLVSLGMRGAPTLNFMVPLEFIKVFLSGV